MRITRPFVSALAVISVGVLFIAAQPAKADFTFYFTQTGTNTVVITGTGSFNTAGLGTPWEVATSSTTTVATVAYDSLQVGALAVSGSSNVWYTLDFPLVQGPTWFWDIGPEGRVIVGPDLPTSGAWMQIYPDGPPVLETSQGQFSLPFEYVSGAPLSNTTTWIGVTLADFGYTGTWTSPVLEGTWTLHNPTTGDPTGDTIRIYSVPEPSQMMLLAGAGLTFGVWRMRKLRRKPVATTATAC